MLQKTIDIQNLSSKRLNTSMLKHKVAKLQHGLEKLSAYEKARCFSNRFTDSNEEDTTAAEDEDPLPQYQFVSPRETTENAVRIVFVDRREMELLQRQEDNVSSSPTTTSIEDAIDNTKKEFGKPTADILSWNDEDHNSRLIAGCGDIAICLCEVFANAKRDNLPRCYCLLEILLHGMWHLYGMRHDYQDDSLTALSVAQQQMLIAWSLWGNTQAEKEAMELIL